MRHLTTDTRIGILMHIHWKTKKFLLRVIVTQVTLLTQTHTLEWHYKLLTYCTCCPQVTGGSQWDTAIKEAPNIDKDSSQLSIFMSFSF